MSSFGFPIFVVTTLIAGTAAAIVLTPKDMLRSNVVEAKSPRYAAVDTVITPAPQQKLYPAETATPTVQLASLTVTVTPLPEAAPALQPAPTAPVAAPAVAADIRQITAGVLNMRSEPNKYSDLIVSLSRGTRVSVSDTSGSWAYVTTPDGTSGWLSQNFLAPAE